jgi:hypothetical protein
MTINVGGHRPHPQNGTAKHKGPRPRIYANHGGTNLRQGITSDPPPPGGAVNRGGTFGMGTLKKGKQK